jgi:release factor glutamine methyltransferase
MAESGNVADLGDDADRADSAGSADRAAPGRLTGEAEQTVDAADQDTVRALLQRGWAQLALSSGSTRLDAELVLAHALRQPRSYLQAHDDDRVDEDTIERYRSLLARCAEGEPLAYLTGEREFWSLPLAVTPEVLIPRPETELAVERCLALRDAAPADIADLGTGSGAIALALAVERRQWRIVATDRAAGALQVARANAQRLGVQSVEFSEGDWFAPLSGRRFDLIVSNPPYVAAGDPALGALRYEPAMALSPGASGMEALRRIVLEAPAYLLPGAWLVLEHGAGQAEELAGSLVAAGYARVRCHADLAGRDRVTEAQWP